MRICIVSREYPPSAHLGGIGTVTYHRASELARRGHDVTVVAENTAGASEWDDGLVNVIRWDAPPFGARTYATRHVAQGREVVRRYAYSRIALSLVRAAADDEPFDVVDMHVWQAEPILYREYGRAPLVLHVSTPESVIREQQGRRPNRRLDRLDRICVRLASVVVANSQENQRLYEQRLGLDAGRTVLVPHGVPVDADPVLQRERAESRELLFVGRLEERKGVRELIEALPTILAQDPTITLTVAGFESGRAPGGLSFREYCDHVVPSPLRDRVTFAGRLTDDELSAAYRRCALCLVPSHYESFGMVLIEAMIHGAPVVASRAGGMPEIVDNDVGRLVPPGRPDALAAAILELMADRELRNRLGANAADRVRAKFSVEAMVDGTLTAYERAARPNEHQ